jgi:hypothetical protein
MIFIAPEPPLASRNRTYRFALFSVVLKMALFLAGPYPAKCILFLLIEGGISYYLTYLRALGFSSTIW